MSKVPPFASNRIALYFLIGFNFLFLVYVCTIGYYNRLAFGDYLSFWALENYGLLNPFKYWYIYWQGRFAPHFLVTVVLLIYKGISSLFFYPIILSSLFVYAFYQILNFYFSLPKLILLNYSILLFSGLLLTTFELSTFFWITASAMYFGGMVFTLLGIVFILRAGRGRRYYAAIAVSFLYAGSSSEHVGTLVCVLLFLVLLFTFFKTAYQSENFISHYRAFKSAPTYKGLLIAFTFCFIALMAMALAPGTKIRMSTTPPTADALDLLRKSYDSTIFVCRHIFYKLPYIVAFIPTFVLFGSYLKSDIIKPKLHVTYVFAIALLGFLGLIFVSNIPIAIALGTVGPLRAYVYASSLLIIVLFLSCAYFGFRYRSNKTIFETLSTLSLVVLFAFVAYTLYSEVPLLRKFNQTDRERLSLLIDYKSKNRREPVFLPALFNPEYTTISDVWRKLTRTDNTPSLMSDVPVVVSEIGETSDWRNNQLKLGLGLPFDVYLAPKIEGHDRK